MHAATDTTVIGAGQAGLSMSRLLSDAGNDHVVVERGRIGERWRSERWPSLNLLTPNWLNRLVGSPVHADPDGFLSSGELVTYFERYAASFLAPVLENTTVFDVRRRAHGFVVRTSGGTWDSRNVVIATGDAASPALPAIAASAPPGLHSMHTSRYRSPDALPDGAVLVVGAGPSGQQIAAELRRAGRDVVLSVGGHRRLPRRYRGRDIFGWLQLSGILDETLHDVPDARAARRARSLPLSGARGGERIDLGVLSELGVVIAGHLTGLHSGRAHFADDLEATAASADAALRQLLMRIDAFAAQAGLDDQPPEDIAPVELPPTPDSVDLRGFGAIVWATGYKRSYPWLRVPVFDAAGEIVQARGSTAVSGLFTLGMKFQWRRKSHYIGGVGDDAVELVERIVERGRGRPATLAA